jgi:hypothetical protein
MFTSAALRKHWSPKPVVSPLSREYIGDRIDIDDPLNDFQIRHERGGLLQGFLLWTNFTTWTVSPKWHRHYYSNSHCMDADGSLAKELNALPRSGDPAIPILSLKKLLKLPC